MACFVTPCHCRAVGVPLDGQVFADLRRSHGEGRRVCCGSGIGIAKIETTTLTKVTTKAPT